MKRILVTGCGGTPAINFTRSLRLAVEKFYLVGVDCDKYSIQKSEADESHLVPDCAQQDYLPILMDIIRETKAELIFVQPDAELMVLSEAREKLPCRFFWPEKATVSICMNKYLSFKKWEQAGLKVPQTMLVNNEEDLRRAFRKFGPMIWIRNIRGAFGKGSLPTEKFEQAKAWIDFHEGWGNFSAARCLSAQSVTWQSIWKEGQLVLAQGRKRLYWEFANRTPSGVTGITGTGVTVSDPLIDDTAQRAILAIDKRPHGIFSVDMTYDKENIPNPTEINIGRFFTTHLFFSAAGLNMPYIFVKLAYGEEPPAISKKINPLPAGLTWVRGMDKEPVLTNLEHIESFAEELDKRRRAERISR
ncbi:MAG: carboxylate--amine ligase [Candidatus Omnitrophica bacterium]|nr:carboxylate--amine ligase [Candidatus Omnitrophota bacterium]